MVRGLEESDAHGRAVAGTAAAEDASGAGVEVGGRLDAVAAASCA